MTTAPTTDPARLERPIFIVGPGRSGTTLLRSLLSAHSRIAITPETKFMARAEQWGLQHGAPQDFEAYWRDYTAWLRFRDLGVDAGRCRELIECQGSRSFAAIFRAVLCAYGERTGKPRVGEKTPTHVRYLPQLLDWFPDARVLVTQRDPRAVIASQLQTYYVRRNIAPRSLGQGVFAHKREQELIFWARDWAADFQTRLPPWRGDPRFHTVVYERLVHDEESEVRAIFEFLEEPYEPAVLTRRSEHTVPAHAARNGDDEMERWRQEHHSRSLQEISADSVEKWRDELSPAEIALVEAYCGPTMRSMGYAPSLTRLARTHARAAAATLATAGTLEQTLRGGLARSRRRLGSVRAGLGQLAQIGVAHGVPPAWFGYRRVIRETVQDYFARRGGRDDGSYETVHPTALACNPLPCNIGTRDALPADRGWWGYSFRDVPQRTSGETFLATLPECLVTWYRDAAQGDDFYPAILNRDGRALEMRELRFRPRHAAALRAAPPPVRLERAVWFAERVYHNHSHWLTAHLPKLLWLRERGLLDQVLLPPWRSAAIDGSLTMLGMPPASFQSFDPERPLQVEALTVLGTDRFRPELLQLIPPAFGVGTGMSPQRKVFISRAHATRRRLLNEAQLWSLLEPQGFERVLMERLSFDEQVELMRQTAVLVAPHGAGLTNMVFCPRGAHIVEIADLAFPNPNFYALASAMGHRYWIVPAESRGDVHPLEKDLLVDATAVAAIVPRLDAVAVDAAAPEPATLHPGRDTPPRTHP